MLLCLVLFAKKALLLMLTCATFIGCLDPSCGSYTYSKNNCATSYSECEFVTMAVAREVQCAVNCDVNRNCQYYIMDSSQTDSCILCLMSSCGSQAKPAWFDQVASDKCSLRNEDTVMIVEFGYQGYMMYNKATAPDFFYFWSTYSSSYLLFNYHIQFSFQTTANTGIFFYAQPKSSAAAHIKIDFLAGYMSGGKITHKIKNGAATTEDSKLTTTKTYNDGKWHFGSFYKQKLYQQLCIDEECLEETIPGVSDAANAEEKVFFGGVPSSIKANVNYNIGTTSSFEGYVANITISSKALPPAVTCLNVTAPKIN